MDGFVATTEDSWTDGKAKTHFSSLSVHLMLRVVEKLDADVHSLSEAQLTSGNVSTLSGEVLKLKAVSLVIDFSVSSATDKACDVADGYSRKLAQVGIAVSNVSNATLDGAAVGVAAKRLLMLELESYRVCGPHHTARAVLRALGVGSKTSLNEEGKLIVLRNRKMGTYFHCSTANTALLMQKQRELGVSEGKELCAAVGDVSRWGADLFNVERNNVLEGAINRVLEQRRTEATRRRRQTPESPIIASAIVVTQPERPRRAAASAALLRLEEQRREEEIAAAAEASEGYVLDSSDCSSSSNVVDDAAERRTVRERKVPRPLTEPEWDANSQMEGALRLLQRLTLQTEGDVPVADMELTYVIRCVKKLEQETVRVPRRKTGSGSSRMYDEVLWADCAEAVQVFREVVVWVFSISLCFLLLSTFDLIFLTFILRC
jgi:hypothetical protein